jgi:hypothetical protein
MEVQQVKAERVFPKAAFGGMLAIACLGLVALAASTSAQLGASGYHLIKKVQLSGTGGWDYLATDAESRRLFLSQDKHVIVLDADTGDVVGDIANTPDSVCYRYPCGDVIVRIYRASLRSSHRRRCYSDSNRRRMPSPAEGSLNRGLCPHDLNSVER